MTILETERLILRLFQPEDISTLYEILSSKEVMKYYEKPLSLEETQQWYERSLKRYADYKGGLWAAVERSSGKMIGQAGLVMQEVENQQDLEVGYMFHNKWWGKGLATEAALACRDYAFKNFSVDRLIALIDPRNGASAKVAGNIGMHYEKAINKWNKTLHLYMISSN